MTKNEKRTTKNEPRVTIYSLAFGGEGVGRIDGKVCFVEDALPGEEVRFRTIKETDSYIKGTLLEVITPSPDRVKPACPYYGKCGGCQLQHISYKKELHYKREQAVELIRRIAGIKDFNCETIVASSDPYHYRSSVTLHRGKGGEIGYYARDARTVLEIKGCPIAEESINEALKKLPKGFKADRFTLKSDHNGRVWTSGKEGERFFWDKYREKEIVLSPRIFSQCNRYIAEKVSEIIDEWAGTVEEGTGFFDLFCGAGFFSFLTRAGYGVKIGIDSERTAIDCAKTTMRKYVPPNMKFYKAEVEKEFFKIFERNKLAKNTVLLDPPRKGLQKAFLEKLKSVPDITGIYYLSCDPARLARDIKLITEEGAWKLGRTQFFDMFPRTKHIETLAEFVRP